MDHIRSFFFKYYAVHFINDFANRMIYSFLGHPSQISFERWPIDERSPPSVFFWQGVALEVVRKIPGISDFVNGL